MVAAPSLGALMTRRRQVMAMLVSEKNRLASATSLETQGRIEVHIEWLEQELEHLARELRWTVLQDPVLRRKDELLRSAPGVGEQVSLALLAYLPQLGELNRKQIAALVGVAPAVPDRDAPERRRLIWGGRARVRAALYMGALVASRRSSRNVAIRDFYQRLVAADKPKKVAQAACMRKLLLMLNSMVKHDEPWQARAEGSEAEAG